MILLKVNTVFTYFTLMGLQAHLEPFDINKF